MTDVVLAAALVVTAVVGVTRGVVVMTMPGMVVDIETDPEIRTMGVVTEAVDVVAAPIAVTVRVPTFLPAELHPLLYSEGRGSPSKTQGILRCATVYMPTSGVVLSRYGIRSPKHRVLCCIVVNLRGLVRE